MFKPEDEDKQEFIERIKENLDMFVHDTKNVSITATYNEEDELLEVKTLRLNEFAN